MTHKQFLKAINKLSADGQIQLLGELWDNIIKEGGAPTLSQWQKDELDRRYSAFKSGDYTLHDAHAVHEGIAKKYQ